LGGLCNLNIIILMLKNGQMAGSAAQIIRYIVSA
jgi:hypothetical protein